MDDVVVVERGETKIPPQYRGAVQNQSPDANSHRLTQAMLSETFKMQIQLTQYKNTVLLGILTIVKRACRSYNKCNV